MQPISESERRVANINSSRYEPFVWEGEPHPGQSVLQLDDSTPRGTGFHIFKMDPGATTTPHEHGRGEHFYVIEGDLVDHDGFEYGPGDIVYLKPGTVHNSTTRGGCTLVVFLEQAESSI